MFKEAKITAAQKTGLVACLPKKKSSMKPGEYRPVNTIDADYEILARILANSSRPTLSELIRHGQYYGVSGRTIFVR
jgi:hypothetical protein